MRQTQEQVQRSPTERFVDALATAFGVSEFVCDEDRVRLGDAFNDAVDLRVKRELSGY